MERISGTDKGVYDKIQLNLRKQKKREAIYMWDGWIKAAAASPEIRVADCQYNAAQIQKTMQQAEEMAQQELGKLAGGMNIPGLR